MSEHTTTPVQHDHPHPTYGTFIKVWVVLLALTMVLVGLSHISQTAAVWGLLTVTPVKAGLVFYYFMHLKYEPPLLVGVVFVTLGTLLIFFALLFADIAFRF